MERYSMGEEKRNMKRGRRVEAGQKREVTEIEGEKLGTTREKVKGERDRWRAVMK